MVGDKMVLRVWDVEHGACAMITNHNGISDGRLAMIDSGWNSTTGWRPSTFIRNDLKRRYLDYLLITNADNDHLNDLEGFWDNDINIRTLHRSRAVSPESLRAIKEKQGDMTKHVERFLRMHESYTAPASEPINDHMGGITFSTFNNSFPEFTDTNNLSMVVFVKYAGFKMLFPGDMEKGGWRALLQQPAFVNELKGTNILNASHHGRENGFLDEVFKYFTPDAVIISDKPIVHKTQETVPDYRNVTSDAGIIVSNTGKKRHVLTTRRDGHITIEVSETGRWTVTTECAG